MAIGRFTKNLQFEKAPELSFEEAMFVPMQRKAEKDKIMDSLYAIDSDVLATEQDKTGILNDYSNQFNSKIEDISNSLLGSGSDLSDLRRKTLAVKKDVEQSKNSGVYFQANKFYKDLEEAKTNFFSPENGQDRELLNQKWNEQIDEWKAKGTFGAFDPTSGELRNWGGQWAMPPKDQDHIKHMLEVARTAGVQTSDISPARIQTTKGPNGAVVFSLVGDVTKLSNSKNLQHFVNLMNEEYSTGASAYARDWDFKGLTMDDLSKQLEAVYRLTEINKEEKNSQVIGSNLGKSNGEGGENENNADLRTTDDVVSGGIFTNPQDIETTATSIIDSKLKYDELVKNNLKYYKVENGQRIETSPSEATSVVLDYGGIQQFKLLSDNEGSSLESLGEEMAANVAGNKKLQYANNILDYMEPIIKAEMIEKNGADPSPEAIQRYKEDIKADPAAYRGYVTAFLEDHNNNYGSQGVVLYKTTGIGPDAKKLAEAIEENEKALLGKTTNDDGVTSYSNIKLYPLTNGYDDPVNISDLGDDVEFNIVGRVSPENISQISTGFIVEGRDLDGVATYYTIKYNPNETPNLSDVARHNLTREIANPKNLKGNYTMYTPDGGSVDFNYSKNVSGITVTPTITSKDGTEEKMDSFTVAKPSDVTVTFGVMRSKLTNKKINNASIGIKDSIREMESGNNYNSLYNTDHGSVEDFYNTAGREYAGKDISTLTVNEVLDLQDKFVEYQNDYGAKGNGSSAVGGYQFIKPTLERLLKRGDIWYNQVFTDELQETLADMLFSDAGVFDYVAGTSGKSVDEIIYNLSKIWAAVPMGPMGVSEGRGDSRDNSYYKGTGNNRALKTYEEFKEVIENSKK